MKASVAKLCKVCSQLDTQLLAHPLYPCRNPLPCVRHLLERVNVGKYLMLGTMDEIKHRRSTCDICKLVAEGLDKEPSDLTGECRITEAEKYCSFMLPKNVIPEDPGVTHFHLTQASVIFDTTTVQGPVLPWEVKSRDERSGHYVLHFQTKARSCTAPGGPTLVPLQSEQEFLKGIGGRYVGTQVDVQLIRAWLRACECEHGKDCMPPTQLLGKQYKEPMFVIDVIDSCLVATPLRCRYVALSYVWGRAAVFRHLLENTQDLRKPGSLRSLPIPATIQDAITLVHALGERYLWVDSLCIIQDDLSMQQTEIMRMGSIYSHSLFTIIAAAGDHAHSGLPGVKQGSRKEVQKTLKLANSELLTVLDVRNTQSGIDDTIWGQRAWTFQEGALSNRVLVFSENQVYWRCRVTTQSEERVLENIRVLDRHHPSFTQHYPIDFLSWTTLQPLDYCELYNNLLYAYRQRRLTYQTDILNAFNGVTEILAALQDDAFFWGLPGLFFSYAMAWELTRDASRNHIQAPIMKSNGGMEMVPIPSWSWAAWSGQDSRLRLASLIDGYGGIVCPLIQFRIVDNTRQLVAIKEEPWPTEEHSGDRIRASWKHAHPRNLPSPSHNLPLQVGQLHFLTCLVNVQVVRKWGTGVVDMYYDFSFSPDFRPNPHATVDGSEIIHQDFIVIAARTHGGLILLAVEWKEGVAYRLGTTQMTKVEWERVDSGNKQWRWITLG